MTENQYTDGPDSFEPEPLPQKVDASEYRDIDISLMDRHGGTPDSSTVSAANEHPIIRPNGRRPAVADGGAVTEYDDVQNVGARSYEAMSRFVPQGVGTYPGQPVLLVGEDPSRLRLFISNPSADPVLIGPLAQVQSGTGYLLAQGQFDPKVQGPIYASMPAGAEASVNVGLWIERGV